MPLHGAAGAVPVVSQAVIVRQPHDLETFASLGAALRAGNLVAFPTETVYGLGANGLDPIAVLKIFKAKGRPLHDPCILHVASAEDALQLLDLGTGSKSAQSGATSARAMFDLLAAACWPGPLSIVGPAKQVVPPEVTAGTRFVAVRCPAHPVARQLLEAANVPVAAPSANRFGHISPTSASHVMDDLGHVPGLQVLDGGSCQVGIESTVLKLEISDSGQLVRLRMLRRGGVTRDRLHAIIQDGVASGALLAPVPVTWPEVRISSSVNPHQLLAIPDSLPGGQVQESPGMMLRHYSPAIRTVLLSVLDQKTCGAALGIPLDRCVLIDFCGRMRCQHALFLKAFNLCGDADTAGAAAPFRNMDSPAHGKPGQSTHDQLAPRGGAAPEPEVAARPQQAEAACAQVFAVLRAAEALAASEGGELICIVDFCPSHAGGFEEALHDRLFRAAAGQRAALVLDEAPCLCSLPSTAGQP